MLLREVTYGIELGLGKVTIDPFGTTAFRHHVGDVNVDYSATRRRHLAAGERAAYVRRTRAQPGARYVVVTTGAGPPKPQQVRADGHGVLRFDAPVGVDHRILVRRQG